MSSTPGTDTQAHAEAWLPRLEERLNGHAYEYDDDLPEPLPNRFALISIERRPVAGGRATGQAGRSSWRLSVRGVGRNVDECRWVDHRVTEAVEEARVLIGAHHSTPVRFETSSAPAPDDGRHSSLTTWTYSL